MKKIILSFLLLIVFSMSGCDLVDQGIIDEFTPSLSGIDDVSIPYGTEFDLLEGVTLAETNSENTITYEVKDSDGNVVEFSTTVPREYHITYSVESPDGEVKTFTRKVTVLEENVAAPPTLVGVVDQQIERDQFDTFDFTEGIKALDAVDGEITKNITYEIYVDGVVVSEVSDDYVGVVKVVYSVTNSSGLSASSDCVITISETVVVVDVAPNLEGIDEHTFTWAEFDVYDPLAGVTAIDPEDGNVTDGIELTMEIDGDVVTEVPGTYVGEVILRYSIEDSFGNITSKDAKITIIETVVVTDELPVIDGALDVTMSQTEFLSFDVLLNVVATDPEDGIITENLTYKYYIEGTEVEVVPTGYVGEVKVEYTVADSSNQQTIAARSLFITPDPIDPELIDDFERAAYTADFLYWLTMPDRTPSTVCEDGIDYIFENAPTNEECLSLLNSYYILGYKDVDFGDFTYIGMENGNYIVDSIVLLFNSEGYPTPITVRSVGIVEEGYITWYLRDIEQITQLNTREVPVSPMEASVLIEEFYQTLFAGASDSTSFCTGYINYDVDMNKLELGDCSSHFYNSFAANNLSNIFIIDYEYIFRNGDIPEHYLFDLEYYYNQTTYRVSVEFFFIEEDNQVKLGSILPYSSFDEADPNYPITPVTIDLDFYGDLLWDYYTKLFDEEYSVEAFCLEYEVEGINLTCEEYTFYITLLSLNDINAGGVMEDPENPGTYLYTLTDWNTWNNVEMEVVFIQKNNGRYVPHIQGNPFGQPYGASDLLYTVPVRTEIWNAETQEYDTADIIEAYLADFFGSALTHDEFHDKYLTTYNTLSEEEINALRDLYSDSTYYDEDVIGIVNDLNFVKNKKIKLHNDTLSYYYPEVEFTVLEVDGVQYIILRGIYLYQ